MNNKHYAKRPALCAKKKIMLINYLKIAVRYFLRRKVHSVINVFGLAAGMAVTIMIILWVQDELSYGSYHVNSENIYHVYKSVYTNNNDYWTLNTSAPLANTVDLVETKWASFFPSTSQGVC